MTFNLTDEPFLPCLLPDGSSQELGLREGLCQAHEIAALHDESPLVTVALTRLLLALVHRTFGPSDREEWERLWEAGRFDAGRFDAYFEKWRERFNLFDPKRPFYQTGGFEAKNRSSVNRLVQERSRGNNSTLFDHTLDDASLTLSPAAAARAVVTDQAFAVGGGKSDLGNTTHAPLVGGAVVLPNGATLFETLMLNLLIYNEDEPFPAEDDLPVWERDKPPSRGQRGADGYLDYLTWQSRTVLLHPDAAKGRIVVRQISYAQGRQFAPPGGFYDPSMAYRRDPKEGDRPIRFSEHKELWRDSAALFQFSEHDVFAGPRSLRWLGGLVRDGVLPTTKRYDLGACGLCADKAKVKFWRHDRMPLPLSYLTDKDLVEKLKLALEHAEKIAAALRSGVRAMASAVLAPGAVSPDKDRVWDLVNSLAPDRLYWSRLEVPFRKILVDLPGEPKNLEAQQTHRDLRLARWVLSTLRPTARQAFDETAGQLDHSARTLRAVAGARAKLGKDLNTLCRPFKEYLHEQPR